MGYYAMKNKTQHCTHLHPILNSIQRTSLSQFLIDTIVIPLFKEFCTGRKEGGNVSFNDALNTLYLQLYGVSCNIWLRTIVIVRKETRCHHIGYSFRLTARVLLYAPSHRKDNTYHSLCYTSHRALAGTRNSSMGPPHEGSIRRPIAPWANALTTELHLAPRTSLSQFLIDTIVIPQFKEFCTGICYIWQMLISWHPPPARCL